MVTFLLTMFPITIDHIDDLRPQNLFLRSVCCIFKRKRSRKLRKTFSFLFFSVIAASNSLSALERRYRLCSTLLDHPPSLPSPPLAIDSNEKLADLLLKESDEIRDDESIISTSSTAEEENLMNTIESENLQLLKTLSSNSEHRSLSPVFTSEDHRSLPKNSETFARPSSSPTAMVDIKQEMNETSVAPGGNDLEKKERPLVEGTDKVKRSPTILSHRPFPSFLFRSQ